MLNNVNLMGRLTEAPEVKSTTNGIKVANFTLAINRDYEQKQTDFIEVVAWRKTAEFAEKYLQKGQLIALNGRIQTRTYEDKSGNNRKVTEVLANNLYFTGKNNDKKQDEEIDVDYEDLPF